MGINGLWDLLKPAGEVWTLADYAAAHFERHKRPLRIAVDEAQWRFQNLTDEQVLKIREGEPAANPVEKVILQRIVRQYRLNIQLLFVWDGPQKPGKDRHRKKGPGGGLVDRETVKSLHRMFDALRVPYHRAPAEAEAECAELLKYGIVDAVWSDDCDSFMFGCTTLIKSHKVERNKRQYDQVEVYKASTIFDKLKMTQEGLILFAMLAGGDYDLTGVKGCGPQTAKRIASEEPMLVQGLMMCKEERDLPAWRQLLISVLQRRGHHFELPPKFPKWKALTGYRDPTVSTEAQCRNLSHLQRRGGWDQPIDQEKLRLEIRERFNWNTKEYLKHIAPVLLVRRLRNATPERRQENMKYKIRPKRVTKKNGEEPAPKSAINMWFNPASLVEDGGYEGTTPLENLHIAPPAEEDLWSNWASKDGKPYDPREDIDCEDFLKCLLVHGLPEGGLEQQSPSKKKRKAGTDDDEGVDGPLSSPSHDPKDSSTVTVKGGRKRKDPSQGSKPVKRRKRTVAAPEPSPPRPEFRRIEIPEYREPRESKVIDLCGDDSDSDEDIAPEEPSRHHVSPVSTPRSSQLSASSATAPSSRPRPPLSFKPLKPSKFLPSPATDRETPRPSIPASKPKAQKSSTPSKNDSVMTTEQALLAPSLATCARDRNDPSRRDSGLVSSSDRTSSHHSPRRKSTSIPDMTPGEVIPAATLRQLRAAALSNAIDQTESPASVPSASSSGPSPKRVVIDLT